MAVAAAAAPRAPASRLARLGVAVLAGLAQLAAFPPLDWWWAAPVGVAALLAVCTGTAGSAWRLAFVAYLVLFLPLLEWIRFLGVAPWLLLCVLQAAIAAVVGPVLVVALRAAGRPAVVRAVAVVCAFVLVEAVRGRAPFGGLTWGRLAFSQSDSPLLGWAGIGGAPLVTAATAATGLGLFVLVRRPPAPHRLTTTALAAALACGPALIGAAVHRPVDGRAVTVAAVQGNVPGDGLDAFAEDLVVLDNHLQQTERLMSDVEAGRRSRPDLVIWPENVADQDPRTEPQTRARLGSAVELLGQPLLLGALLEDDERRSNALLVYGPDGVQQPVYAKKHLVPFGEYLPLRSLVERLYPAARTLLARDFSPGGTVGRLDLQGVPLAVGTCFEVAFDDLPRQAVLAGGQLLVLPSNNASYGRSAQSAQQLAMARLRAVEHGRATVVATTSGISALIAPDGRVLARTGLYEADVLMGSLPRRTDLTLATRIGPFVEAGLVTIALLMALALTEQGRWRHDERATAG